MCRCPFFLMQQIKLLVQGAMIKLSLLVSILTLCVESSTINLDIKPAKNNGKRSLIYMKNYTIGKQMTVYMDNQLLGGKRVFSAMVANL